MPGTLVDLFTAISALESEVIRRKQEVENARRELGSVETRLANMRIEFTKLAMPHLDYHSSDLRKRVEDARGKPVD